MREERGTTLARATAASKIPPPTPFPSREREGGEISTWNFPSSNVSSNSAVEKWGLRSLQIERPAIESSTRTRRAWMETFLGPSTWMETFRHVRPFDRTRLSIRFLTILTWLRKLWRGEFRNVAESGMKGRRESFFEGRFLVWNVARCCILEICKKRFNISMENILERERVGIRRVSKAIIYLKKIWISW